MVGAGGRVESCPPIDYVGSSGTVSMEVSLVGGAGGRASTGVLEFGVDRVGKIEGDPVSSSSSVGGGVLLVDRASCWYG